MSNIMSMLSGELMSGSAVSQVAKAANVSEEQAKSLIDSAVPLLVQAMSSNAGTPGGADSLYKALGQHKSSLSAAKQLEKADTDDGDKIIGKILGDNKQGVTEALARQAGVTKGDSAKMLALLAPVLMSLISTETSTSNTSSGGLASLLSLFTDDGSSTQTSSGLGGLGGALLSGFFGGSQTTTQASSNGLDGALLNGTSASGQSNADQGNLLSGLLGGSSNNNTSSLLGSLAGSLLSDALKGTQEKTAAKKTTAKRTCAKKTCAKKPADKK